MTSLLQREPGLSRLLLLGLSPLLLVSDSLLKAMLLALSSLGVMLGSALLMGFIRPLLRSPASSSTGSLPPTLNQASRDDFILLAIGLLLTAILTVIANTLVQIFLYPVYKITPLFMPLLFASSLLLMQPWVMQPWVKQGVQYRDAGLFATFLLLQAAARELLIHGAILTDLPLLLPGASAWFILGDSYRKLVLLAQPAGALLLAGMLFALLRLIHGWRQELGPNQQKTVTPVTRARVTARTSQQIKGQL
ncbi:MAG: Rnf-Nqr domain containing protein [Pseudomonadales bacterium]|nr:Rnf-Nqr domain containing protein [Pseudomonadales bacterium]